MTRAFYAAALVPVVALAACGGGRRDDAASKAAAAAPVQAPAGTAGAAASYFTVPPEQLAHVEIAQPRRIAFATELKTTGTVDWDNDHTSQAITQVSGPITRLLVDTGVQVKAGQPLLYVASPDITGAFSTYRKARNRLALAQQNDVTEVTQGLTDKDAVVSQGSLFLQFANTYKG